MNINQIKPCDSVLPHHVVMLRVVAVGHNEVLPAVVYSGLLKEVPATAMDAAELSLMHPGTLAEVKVKADAALAAKLIADDYTDEDRRVWQDKMTDFVSP